MSCVKTGAQVWFENYGMLVVADLYTVGDCWIIRWNVDSRVYGDRYKATHIVDIWEDSSAVWHRDDIGVTVLPSWLITLQ